MTLEPRHAPIVPSYGTATLADLSSSILASLDPEAPPEQNVLGLAPAQRAKASASYQLTCLTGASGSNGVRPRNPICHHAPSTSRQCSGADQPSVCSRAQPSDIHNVAVR